MGVVVCNAHVCGFSPESLSDAMHVFNFAEGRELPNPFSDPSAEAKLRAHPKTSAYMDDPTFVAMLRSLQLDPKNLAMYLKDTRIMESLGVLMGVDFSVLGGGGGGGK